MYIHIPIYISSSSDVPDTVKSHIIRSYYHKGPTISSPKLISEVTSWAPGSLLDVTETAITHLLKKEFE